MAIMTLPVTTGAAIAWFYMEEYNRLLDANELYDGGTKAIAGSAAS